MSNREWHEDQALGEKVQRQWEKEQQSPPWLPELLRALGWQGGTIHQALATVTRLAVGQSVFKDQVAALLAAYERGDEPEGAPSARRTLLAIGDLIGPECSVCRRRHGRETEHASE